MSDATASPVEARSRTALSAQAPRAVLRLREAAEPHSLVPIKTNATLGESDAHIAGLSDVARSVPVRKSPARCPRQRGWIRAACSHRVERWVRPRCKTYGCSVCGPQRRRKAVERIARGSSALVGETDHRVAAFITLTYGTDPLDPRKDLQQFIRWLRRRVRSAQYAVVREFTKKGRLHFHLVVAPWTYTHQSLISREWNRITGSRVVWVSAINSNHDHVVAVYMAKYMMKRDRVPNGKALTYSRGWPNPVDQNGWADRIDYEYVFEDAPVQLENRIKYGSLVIIDMNTVGDSLNACDCFDFKNRGDPDVVETDRSDVRRIHQGLLAFRQGSDL